MALATPIIQARTINSALLLLSHRLETYLHQYYFVS